MLAILRLDCMVYKMKLVIDCTTGEEITRPLSAEELAQQEIDEAAGKVKQAQAAAKEAARQALLDKLGITAEEAKLLLG
jgi:hypothetical protein